MSVEKSQCSFCDRWTDEVPFMVEASETVHICNLCVEEYTNPPAEIIVKDEEAAELQLACSFCGKPYHDVNYLMQGYSEACICDACVGIARTVVEENL
jgi:nitrous oxide reductase accessory protein NosL